MLAHLRGAAGQEDAYAAGQEDADAAGQEDADAADQEDAAAAEDAPTVGYLWPSSSGLGYALIYAHRVAAQDGGEHITVVTRRPLGPPGREPWQATGGARSRTADDFTVVELRLDSSGHGEGKMSLATEVAFDENANTISLEDYDAAPVLLEDVQRQPERYRSLQD